MASRFNSAVAALAGPLGVNPPRRQLAGGAEFDPEPTPAVHCFAPRDFYSITSLARSRIDCGQQAERLAVLAFKIISESVGA
jgi:hypothetical protein